MSNTIVIVNVTQTIAPTPSKLQQTGAMLSMGGTTTAQGTKTLITQPADLTAILKGALALNSLAWSGGTVTATTSSPHGYSNALQFRAVIAGAVPTAYNGKYLITITGASTFTYALAGNPGSETTPGTYQPASSIDLVAMVTTFFAQGNSISPYVLELGASTDDNAVAYLDTWIDDNPGFFYSYLVPRAWVADAAYLTFVGQFENTTAKTYFFTPCNSLNYGGLTAQMKAVIAVAEPGGIPATEYQAAAWFYSTLKYKPSTTNKVSPLAFTFIFDVTQYPTSGNGALLQAFKDAGINWVGSGAEGGISDTIILWGTTMDVRPFNYWYSVDWTAINLQLDMANAIINGSNNNINPLYYNQNGIDRLQNVGANTLSRGVTYGLILGKVVQEALDGPDFAQALDDEKFAGQTVINAVPFIPYCQENPSDYKDGVYNGFSAVMTPLRGFEQITFNLNVTDFVAGP